ncbi:sulfite exporter TauE/SafE family protein 3-like [Typha angustifolia]|uniref:sulfite exporter TauE/SafE family protein 3-like n=1 Tax=Typha angustifolia TaxID=59011 RepID=UPI003C2B55D9
MGGGKKTSLMWVGVLLLSWSLVLSSGVAFAKRPLSPSLNETVSSSSSNYRDVTEKDFKHIFSYTFHSLFDDGESSYNHVWPDMEFGWRVVLGSIIGFLGAALGSIGGVGGGGIFVPMLTLIIGFDPKTSTAISKCMIMGAAGSTVYYNLRLRHPSLDLPIIDYDLALLFQPMLMLGISIGVAFNVIFPDWMVTVLLIILFLGTSTKALFKGIETWKKESLIKKEAAKLLASQTNETPELEYKPLLGSPGSNTQIKFSPDEEVPIKDNIYWKELMMLLSVWVAFLIVQIVKTYARTCSIEYWVLNTLQVPIAASVTLYEALSLCKGKRTIASRGKQDKKWKLLQLLLYCSCGVVAGIVGGLLGLGGGFILGPLFLEMGVPPQVASATSTFAMTFSSSMSVIQYYLLDRFPVPYAGYFIFLATVAAFTGQHIVRRLIVLLGRASLIIFILALTIFVSAISLGGVGIANIVEKMERKEHMGFVNLCYHN